MAILQIVRSSRNVSRCKSCGAAIEWGRLVSGARMPFDYPIIVQRIDHQPDGIIDYVDADVSTSHFATCPDAASWRRRRKADAES